jgi:hypothetical protein
MKRLLLLLFFLPFTGNAQQILWEKYWPNLRGQFDAVVEGDSGHLFGVGNCEYHRTFANGQKDTIKGTILVKMDSDGDTLWVKKVGDEPYLKPYLFSNQNGTLTLIYWYIFWPTSELRIALIAENNGSLMLQNVINNFFFLPLLNQIIKDKDENFWLIGQKRKDSNPNESEMACLKITFLGDILAYKSYNPGNHPFSMAHYIEPMPGGRMRMSGNKGKTIVSYELDSLGNASNYKEYISNPYNFVQQNGAYVQQADSGYFLVSVNIWDGLSWPNVRSLVRKVKANGEVVWGGGKNFGGEIPIPTLDGGYIRTKGLNSVTYYERYLGDSTLAWSINSTNTQFVGNKGIKDLLFFPDQSGAGFGLILKNGPKAYISKFGNVGQPVDPSNPIPAVLSSQPKKARSEIGYAYPNPTTGIFHLLGMGQGRFLLYNSQGQLLLDEVHKGGDGINISYLPCGVYTYSLITPLSKTEGRIMRE